MRITATMLMIIAVITTMRTILVIAITAIIMTMRMSVVDRRSRYSFGVFGLQSWADAAKLSWLPGT